MKSTTNLRSNIEERDSPITCRTLISVDDEGDVLPQRCFLPKGSHLQHNWHMNYRSQVETSSPDANRRHGQVRSLLLKESLLVFIPPLGYMLKFSGSADLHEHVHPTLCGIVSVFTNMHRSGEESTEVSLDIRATAHCRVNTCLLYTSPSPRD